MERCSLCPGVHCCIPCDGPGGDILFIGEAPGHDEERMAKKRPPGRPFIGKTGEEVNQHYLPLAGLQRGRVDVMNAISCLPDRNRGKLDATNAKDLALLNVCAQYHLHPRVERGHYQLLVPLGSFAVKAVCPHVSLDVGHGLPTDSVWGIPVFPMYHPALGIHEPKKMLYIRTDWFRLGQYLRGALLQPTDDYPDPDYQEVTDARELRYLDAERPIACDTESTRKRDPLCFTYSQEAGGGRLIRADRGDLLACLSSTFSRWRAPVLFHNWLYDWPVCRSLGISIPHRRVIDTMSRVFHLGNLPQGLKALAKRELGMEMQDFEDVVKPHSAKKVLNYYYAALAHPWPRPEEQLVRDEKTGLYKLYKPQSMNTKLKRFFTDLSKDENKDIFGIWEKWQTDLIESELGEWPGVCITHVPFGQVLYYACRDVDALIRLFPIIQRMSKLVRKLPQERWRSG